MGHEDDRFKHSSRLHREEAAIRKQTKIAREFGVPIEEPHKFHKRHALNCGNPHCYMCMNPRKADGEKTMQERKFEQRERVKDEDPTND
jgi:hypothetical protein